MADLKQQLNKDYTKYSTKNQKHDQLKSTLDTHLFEADPSQKRLPSEPQQDLTESQGQSKITLTGKTSRAIKTRDLSSDILGLGNSLLKF